jgi:hypothetical protein
VAVFNVWVESARLIKMAIGDSALQLGHGSAFALFEVELGQNRFAPIEISRCGQPVGLIFAPTARKIVLIPGWGKK